MALRVGMSGSKLTNFWALANWASLTDLNLGQRMLRMADEHQRILAQGHHFDLGVARGIGDKAQVNHVAQVSSSWRTWLARRYSKWTLTVG